jgi:hypothetical protein
MYKHIHICCIYAFYVYHIPSCSDVCCVCVCVCVCVNTYTHMCVCV